MTLSADAQTVFLFLALCLVVLTFRPQLARAIDRLEAVDLRGFRAWLGRLGRNTREGKDPE